MGAGMGITGGAMPSPLHFIALTQVGLGRWVRALAILVGLPLVIDGTLLLVTVFFYRYIPLGVAHRVAYVGGATLVAFGGYSLLEQRRRSKQELARSAGMTYGGVTAAALAEITAPGTWVYWLTVVGPVLAEGKQKGYWHVVPFFAGGVVGYYGAAIASVLLMAWGASLHRAFHQRLFLIANLLLIVFGMLYLAHAFRGR